MVGNSENVRSNGSPRRLARALTFVIATALAHATGAQLLDSTLDEVLNDAIDEQVEAQLDAEITDAVQQQVENAVETTVETAVQEQIESAVETTVETVVEQQIEDAVTDTIAQTVEAGVTETVQQQIESGVTGTITQQLQSTVEQAIEGTLEGVVEQGLGSVLENGLGQVVEDVGEAAQRAVGAEAAADDDAPAATETFVAGVDAVGRAAEGQVWVILVPTEHVERIQTWGFNIRQQRTLTGLDRVLLRVDAPEDRDIAQAALDLALDAPGTSVDFNHVYTPSADDAENQVSRTAAGAPLAKATTTVAPSLTIGIIDSSVATTHAAFDGADIVQQDFVSFAAPRPLEHGTAVASILVGYGGVLGQAPHRARLHAATVFFTDNAGKPAATTESLVAALAWHAAEGVDVVNMSLAGPPNRVLETAITAASERGMLIVAAVGNNGPAGEPLYPAAYAPVVGVTAVDSGHRIYRYANRGRHVSFAAPGVRIKVADSAGGYATESGTSMAAPYAAAIIAQAVAKEDSPSHGNVLATLKATAIDLGAKDFDDVFGYGLIAAE